MFRRILNSLKSNLVAGVIVIVPTGLSVWVVYFLWKSVDDPLRSLLKEYIADWRGFDTPGLGLLVVIGLIFLIGLLARTFIGGLLVRLGEVILEHIPVVRALYVGSKQVLSALLGGSEIGFRDVVLVEYPKKNSYVIGFVSSRGKGELSTVNREPILNVFIPTTPNPTSGFLLLVPESRVKRLNMAVEDAVKFIISSGIVADDREYEAPTFFETPTTKMPIEPVPEGLHPEIRRAIDALKKGFQDERTDDEEEDDEN